MTQTNKNFIFMLFIIYWYCDTNIQNCAKMGAYWMCWATSLFDLS